MNSFDSLPPIEEPHRSFSAKAMVFIDQLLFSYSSLIFMKSRQVGFILLATTFFNINIALSGLTALIFAMLFARFIHIRKEDMVNAFYGYNCLLIGLSAGFLFRYSPLSVLLIGGLTVLAFLFTYFLVHLFSYYLKLPILNIPFTVVSTILFLSAGRYSSLFVTSVYQPERFNLEWIPAALQGLLRACGLILFLPYDLTGLIILTGILFFSRIAFFLTIISYYAGILVLALLKGSLPNALADHAAFNFILTGVALGGIFLVPANRSYLLALSGVLVSVFVIDAAEIFWAAFGIPVFTLPFNVVVLLFIYALTVSRYHRINVYFQPSPELSLLAYLNRKRRLNNLEPQPNLPFFGEWTVYQGFSDRWTHKGVWRHALDFVITDENGSTFKELGNRLEDYYAFDKPVVSPVSGYVVDAYDALPDRPIGEVDKKNNWGNYIIIKADSGYFVELSHLKSASLQCAIGAYVKAGQPVALCGNSGYSPQPHLHMQVQVLPYLASYTTHFFIGNAKNRENQLLNKQELTAGTKVKPLDFSRRIFKQLQFILDDSFCYEYKINGVLKETLKIIVRLDENGCYFFDLNDGEEKLYFKLEDYRFVFTDLVAGRKSRLKYLFLAAPSIYLLDDDEFAWSEYLPDFLLGSRMGIILIKSFFHNYFNWQGDYTLSGKNKISGKIILSGKTKGSTELILDDNKGVAAFKVEIGGKTHEFELQNCD